MTQSDRCPHKKGTLDRLVQRESTRRGRGQRSGRGTHQPGTRETDSSPQAPGRPGTGSDSPQKDRLWWHFDVCLLASRNARQCISVVEATRRVVLCSSGPSTQMQGRNQDPCTPGCCRVPSTQSPCSWGVGDFIGRTQTAANHHVMSGAENAEKKGTLGRG